MTEAGRRRRLVARTAITLLALAAATGARATCTANVSGNHIFALTGDSCPFASGTYAPTVLAPGASPPAIVGLFANGGSITAGEDATAVTVNATAASASYGLNAINGGTIGPLDVAGVTTAASSSPAVYATGAGSTITLTLLSPTSPAVATIVTTGVDSAGVLATSGGSVVLTGSGPTGGSVTTETDGSVGLNAFSGSISATGITITTMGDPDILSNPSDAVEVSNSGATVTLTDDTIVTSGEGAVGVFAQTSGMATLSGTATVTTTGDCESGFCAYGLNAASGGVIDASTATSVSVTTSGADAIGVYASGVAPPVEPGGLPTPSTITIGGVATITTYGATAAGVQADSGGVVNLNGGSAKTPNTITTTTDGSIGVYAASAGVININGATTISTGTSGETPTGANAYGVQADGLGSQVNLNAATTITTLGTGAYGLYATAGGAIGATTDAPPAIGVTTSGTGAIGVYASGVDSESSTPSTITIGGVATITTNGATAAGVQADGGGAVTLGAGSVSTNGADSPGVVATGTGSMVTLNGTSLLTVTTITDDSIGLLATSGGVIDDTGPVTISTGSTGETPSGASAYGANADGSGSKITFSGATTLTTNGAGANGLDAYGLYASNGGTIDGSLAPSVAITTSGTGAIGVYASGAAPESGPASSITIGGIATITTNGGSAAGVQADSGGLVTLGAGSVTTNGADAPGVVASGAGSMITLNGASLLSVTTTTDGSTGLYALGGGVINATGPVSVSTGSTTGSTGLNAYGVNADGSGSKVNLAAATIATTGQGAVGLYASNVSATGAGGAITVSGTLGVTTAGASAYGAWAQSAGSTIALNGASTFTINGAAFALFASEGGVITTGSTLGATINGGVGAGGVEASGSGSTVTLSGATTIGLNGASNTGLFATTGGAITTEALTSITVSGASSTGVQATAGTVTATGALNVTTSQASSVAFALGGTAPSIVASGGGTVSAAGNAINFIGATSAVATFDNFHITSASGDLIFADPSTATINFTGTTATANGGNLLNATNGSTIAFNASASTLTGAIQTDATSTTNVSLTNNTNWTMTGSSTLTNLNLTNSSVVFSPSGGFKTLTVGSLVGGTGANVTLNTQLAGAQNTDQIIINGGTATGTTALTIKNASASNAGAATTGSGIPVVVVTNGGTTSTTAFKLATPVTAGGFQYALAENPSNDDWYLMSSPVPSPENAITAASIQNSVNSLAQAQFNNMVTTRLLGSLLLGANEQVSGCDCGGGFAGVGSFALGSHGRWALTDNLTLLAGASWDSFYQDGTNVSASPIVAASLRYDPSNWGTSRPFLEFGAALSPYISASYTRYYNNGFLPAEGVGSAIDRGLAIFGRAGWVARLTPIDEGAVFVDLVRGWQEQGGYTEVSTAVNPFPATVSNGVSREDVVRVGAQYTHLFFGNLEANVNGAVAHGFDSSFGSQVSVLSFGSVAPFPILNSTWVEYGGRLGYRFSRNLVVDAYVLGTQGGEVGRTLHVGLGARYAF